MVRNLIRRMNLFQGQEEGPKYRLALDIGTEYVKAIYIEMDGTNSKVIGVGRARQDYADMENGAVASISGVTCCCRQAITQGSIVAGVKPTEVVIGLAGQFVHGIARTIEKQRIKPDRPITLPELEMFVKEAQKEALKDVMESIIRKLNYPKMDIELVHSSLVSITIDGYPVTNPLDFHGRNLELTIFMTFAPLVHASAMRTIAGRLGLDLLGLVAEPYAVASSSLTDEAYEFGSLVIDIGGGSTDIALIQKRGITGVKMMAMGGRAFTKGLAAHFKKTLRDAEQMKLDFADGIGVSEAKAVIDNDIQIWLDALLIALNDLKKGQPLPPHIAICGGGSGLPGIIEALRSEKVINSGLFKHAPEVTLLEPKHIYGIEDPKEFLIGPQDVTPKSIAYQASLYQNQTKRMIGGASIG